MKRQRGVNVSGVNPPKVEEAAAAAAAKGKKKAKREQGEQNQNGVNSVVEEVSGLLQVGDSVMMGWCWEEQMSWLGDEQMSWGTTWFPWWDMDFMGEAFNALYSDVVWDDDIWNLNNEIPIPLHTKM